MTNLFSALNLLLYSNVEYCMYIQHRHSLMDCNTITMLSKTAIIYSIIIYICK